MLLRLMPMRLTLAWPVDRRPAGPDGADMEGGVATDMDNGGGG